MLFQQVLNFFHKKARTKSQVSHSEKQDESIAVTSTTQVEEEEEKEVSPQVEFEQSRALLELDFFHEPKQRITSFPQFDYLLNQSPINEQHTTPDTLSQKLTRTLRHRMSIYRPTHDSSSSSSNSQNIKRSKSTPIFE